MVKHLIYEIECCFSYNSYYFTKLKSRPISKKIIKDIMIYYKLVTKKTIERPFATIVEDERFFNEGYIGNIFLIVLGLIVVIFSIWVIVGVFK